jgi:hypothetical protein
MMHRRLGSSLRRAALTYHWLNDTRPLQTKAVTSGALLGLGDGLCQLIENRSCNNDSARMGRMVGWGLCVNGPLGHAWYAGLDVVVKTTGARGVICKVLADQYEPGESEPPFAFASSESLGARLPLPSTGFFTRRRSHSATSCGKTY